MTLSRRLPIVLLAALLLPALAPQARGQAADDTASPEPADTRLITLTSGETLRGIVLERTDASLRFAHPVLGELTIPTSAIASSTPIEPGAERSTTAQQPAEAPEAAPDAEAPTDELDDPAPATDWLEPWNASISLGFNASDGNSERVNVRGGFDAARENERHRWLLDAAYNYAVDDGDKSANDFTAGVLKDWLVPESRVFYFAGGRYDYDEFEDFLHRLSGDGGVGYELIRPDDFEDLDLDFRLRGGFGALREFDSDDTSIQPEALLGFEGKWTIRPKQALTFDTFYRPNVEEPIEDARITSSAALTFGLAEIENLNLKLGVENEYETVTSGDAEHNDVNYFLALVYDLN